MKAIKIIVMAIAAFSSIWAQAQATKPQAAATYQTMDLTDLKVDIKQLTGKKVAVKASIQQLGEMAMLKGDPMDMTPVWAVSDALPRDDRKKLANGCQMLLCSGQFYGTVRQGPMGPTLVLDKVDWR